MDVEFYWSRDPKRRFKLKSVNFGHQIVMGSAKDVREFTNYSPLLAHPKKPDPSNPPQSILLAFARVHSNADALNFVNEFGPLTGFNPKGEPAERIRNEARAMADLLSAAADDPPEQFSSALIDYQLDFGFGQLALEIDDSAGVASMKLRIPNLLGALKYMLAQKIAAGTIFKRCAYEKCRQIFDVGEGASRSVKADYCCKKHQISHNNDLRKNRG